MPTRPSDLLTHQQSQAQHDSELLGPEVILQSASTPLRQYIDEDVLPCPDFFETLDELHTWYELRFGDAANDQLEACSKYKGLPHSATDSNQASLNDRRPKLAVCHDFQGGYNEQPDARGYSFEHFHIVDTFIYFSHKRITIPPNSWLKAAGRVDTKVLGTVIFEWKESIPDLSRLLRGPERKAVGIHGAPMFSPQYAIDLIELALERHFSGYLINVEAALDLGFACSGEPWPAWVGEQARHSEMQKNAERLRAWVCFLRDEGRRRFVEAGRSSDDWEIMWYDSVTYPQGQLAWQDALTPNNVEFFKAADSFFTNYTWARPPQPQPPGEFVDLDSSDPQYLQMQGFGLTGPNDGGYHPSLLLSAAMADSLQNPRKNDVYIGIDAFGRNCWGGMQSWKSLEMIGPHRKLQEQSSSHIDGNSPDNDQTLGLSVALFAPGWTWEHDEPQLSGRTWKQWRQQDAEFWLGRPGQETMSTALQKYFAHYENDASRHRTRFNTKRPGFYTNFALGSGKTWSVRGMQVHKWETNRSSSDARLIGWTDMGSCMPKPDLLFAQLSREHNTAKSGSVHRWWMDEDTVFDGNVSLGLAVGALNAKREAIDVPLCSFVNTRNSRAKLTWTLEMAFKCGVETADIITPLVTCDAGSLSCDNFDLSTNLNGWTIGKAQIHAGADWQLESNQNVVTFRLGVRLLGLQDRTSIWLGAISFTPDATHINHEVQPMDVISSPVRTDAQGKSVLSVSLQWPAFSQSDVFYNAWVQLPNKEASRVWLGTSTREVSAEEFCILGLDTAKWFPQATQVQFIATPLCITECGYAAATYTL